MERSQDLARWRLDRIPHDSVDRRGRTLAELGESRMIRKRVETGDVPAAGAVAML